MYIFLCFVRYLKPSSFWGVSTTMVVVLTICAFLISMFFFRCCYCCFFIFDSIPKFFAIIIAEIVFCILISFHTFPPHFNNCLYWWLLSSSVMLPILMNLSVCGCCCCDNVLVLVHCGGCFPWYGCSTVAVFLQLHNFGTKLVGLFLESRELSGYSACFACPNVAGLFPNPRSSDWHVFFWRPAADIAFAVE